MIIIHSSTKQVKVNSWGDAWANLHKRRNKFGGFSVSYNGLLYGGDHRSMLRFCRTADLFSIERAAAELHFSTVGLKLVVNA